MSMGERFRAGKISRRRPPARADYDLFMEIAGRGDTIVVIETDPEEEAKRLWRETGLFLPDGSPIEMRVGPDPIGYLWHDDNGELRPRTDFTGYKQTPEEERDPPEE